MDGLSPAANSIIESFSTLEILKDDYYLIGGTGLALQINHRLSEDLDFCRWIPSRRIEYAIEAQSIHNELKKKFGQVDMNHLDFHQVNFLIHDPQVKITFYQTDLTKPDFTPVPLIGHILMADINVLGGSKMYVVTQRHALRDYYDLMVLVKEGRLTVQQLVEQAQKLSRKITPQLLASVFKSFAFDGQRFKLSDLEKLEPKHKVTSDDYINFCQDIASQVEALQPTTSIVTNQRQQRSHAHLKRKIENGHRTLHILITNAARRYNLSKPEIKDLATIGPYPAFSIVEPPSLGDLDQSSLEELLSLTTGTVRNFVFNLKDKYSASDEDLNLLRSTD